MKIETAPGRTPGADSPAQVWDRHESRPSCLLVNLGHAAWEQIAAEANWRCVAVESAELAQACLDHQSFDWLVVNIAGDPAARRLAERCSREGSGLLTLFGDEHDVCDEIWARQLGVWFYVAGLPNAEGFGWLSAEAFTFQQGCSAAA